MKRFIGVASGFVLFLAGLGLILIGSFGIASFGSDGSYESEPTRVTSTPESLALVADLVGVEVGIPFSDRIGTATINIDAATDRRVFIGLAPQSAVDEFLFGSPYDLITRSGDNQWSGSFVPGVNSELPAPDTSPIWVDQGTGASPDVVLSPDLVQPTMVIMNSDGRPDVSVDLTVAFSGPRIFPISVAAVAFGLALVIIGIPGMAKWGRRRPDASPVSPTADLASPQPESTPPAYLQEAPKGDTPAMVVDLTAEGTSTESALEGWLRESGPDHRSPRN